MCDDERRRGLAADERGGVVVFVALAIALLLSAVALAVDLGIAYTARTESQRVADAAALAGAARLAETNGDVPAVRQEVRAFAAANEIRGQTPSLLDGDIEVLVNDDRVRVTVHNSSARGNPIDMVFAQVIGFPTLDVVTVAEAEFSRASGAYCPLPVALPDRWLDDGDELWDPSTDTYIPYPEAGYTGYGDDDTGSVIEIKTAEEDPSPPPPYCTSMNAFDACNALASPHWYCWWRDAPPSEGGGGGVEALGPLIYPGCSDTESGATVFIGDTIWDASGSGNKQDLVKTEFKAAVDADPDAYWDAGQSCVARPGEGCVASSSRLRSVPLISPPSVVNNGSSETTAQVIGYAGVFIEKVSCGEDVGHGVGPPGRWNVYVRLTGIPGGLVGTGESEGLLKALRLTR